MLYHSCPHFQWCSDYLAPCLSALSAPLTMLLCCAYRPAYKFVPNPTHVLLVRHTTRAELLLGAAWPVHLTQLLTQRGYLSCVALLSQARAHVCDPAAVTLLCVAATGGADAGSRRKQELTAATAAAVAVVYTCAADV